MFLGETPIYRMERVALISPAGIGERPNELPRRFLFFLISKYIYLIL